MLQIAYPSATASLYGCNYTGEWRDEGIDPAIRDEIAALNRQVARGYTDNDPQQILRLCSDTFRAVSAGTAKAWVARDRELVAGKDFTPKSQFYVRLRQPGLVRLVSTEQGYGAYAISFRAITREAVVTIGCFRDSVVQYSMTTIYGKYHGKWKMDVLRIGRYSLLGRQAMSWYQQAEAEYVSGDNLDALNHVYNAMMLLDANDAIISYEKKKDLQALSTDLKQFIKSHYKLPVIDTAVSSRPVIFHASQQIANGASYPLIAYQSKVPLHDTAELSRECDSVHKDILLLFRGLEKNRWAYYRVYNQTPVDSLNQYPSYTFRKDFPY